MINGMGRSDAGDSGTAAPSTIPQECAMCKMPAGDGFGGLKSRVMTGAKGRTCGGM
jgi:hypothetical protein